jgi:hypothetical protein
LLLKLNLADALHQQVPKSTVQAYACVLANYAVGSEAQLTTALLFGGHKVSVDAERAGRGRLIAFLAGELACRASGDTLCDGEVGSRWACTTSIALVDLIAGRAWGTCGGVGLEIVASIAGVTSGLLRAGIAVKVTACIDIRAFASGHLVPVDAGLAEEGAIGIGIAA